MALNHILLLTYFTGHRIAIRPSLLLVISINLQQQQLRLLRLPIPVARCCSIRPMSCALSILRSRGAEEQFPCPQQSAISDDRYIMNPHSRRAATIYGRHQRPFESVYTLTAAPFAIIIKHWAKASRGTHRTPTYTMSLSSSYAVQTATARYIYIYVALVRLWGFLIILNLFTNKWQ